MLKYKNNITKINQSRNYLDKKKNKNKTEWNKKQFNIEINSKKFKKGFNIYIN